jgi:Cof subfamily protein (haloacid dehalogenase superfamily)
LCFYPFSLRSAFSKQNFSLFVSRQLNFCIFCDNITTIKQTGAILMKKFEGWLFATDIDGTLLKNDKTISKENLDAIEYFKSEGGFFTFITGRIPSGTKRILEMVQPNAPFGCINGGGIFDHHKNELLWSVEMSREVLTLVEYIDKNLPDMGIEVNTHKNVYFCKKSAETEKHRRDESFPDLECHYREVKEPFAKILFAGDEKNLLKLIDMLNSHPMSKDFDFVRSDAKYYEILPKGISKGTVVKKLAEILGISAEKIITVGDNDNDAAMLSSAELSFAVANASKRAKSAANFLTVSNEEHAIAKIIDDIDKGRITPKHPLSAATEIRIP